MTAFGSVRTWIGIGALAGGLALGSAAPRAQQAALLMVMDQNAVTANQAPNNFTTADINQTIASAGVRDELPGFMRKRGQLVTLKGGTAGQEGWFGMTTVPANWESAAGANDAAQNFVLAGAGLGSPDTYGNRTSLLGGVPGLKPMRLADMQAIVGTTVCAVTFAGQIPWGQTGTSLKGNTLGIVAFTVESVSASGSGFSSQVRVADADTVCNGALGLATF